MTIENQLISIITDGEVWIGGYLALSSQQTFELTMSTMIQDGTAGKRQWRYRQSVGLSEGNMSLSGFYQRSLDLQRFLRRWNSTDKDDKPILAFWAADNALEVGEYAGITYVVPSGAPVGSGTGTLATLNLSADWTGDYHEGEIKSPHVRDGSNVIEAKADADTVLLQIDGVGGVKRSALAAIADVTGRALAGFTVSEIVGDDANPPEIDFVYPAGQQGWRIGTIPAGDTLKTIQISHTVDGRKITKTVGPYGTHNLVSQVLEDIERLRWPDGFRIFYSEADDPANPGSNTGVTFRGNLGGVNQDLIFEAANAIPGGAPFRGSETGENGDTEVRLFSQTGTGGSAVRVYLTPYVKAEAHDIPVVEAAVVENGFTQLGLEVKTPVLTQPAVYDFQVRYALWYVPEE